MPSCNIQPAHLATLAVQVRTGVFVIAAFYVCADVIEISETEVFARAYLATYKVLRLYIAMDALPRGTNNTLLRRTMRTQWEATHGQA